MDKAAMPEGKYLASVKLGPKGQIVVPKEVREMFGIRPGDTLLLLAEPMLEKLDRIKVKYGLVE